MTTLKKLVGPWKKEVPSAGYSSSIEMRTFDLYNKDIGSYSADDLRFMILQEVGLEHLVSMALSHLEDDILVEAGYYEGDLLISVLSVPDTFWKKNGSLQQKIRELILADKERIDSSLDLSMDADKKLNKLISHFLQLDNGS